VSPDFDRDQYSMPPEPDFEPDVGRGVANGPEGGGETPEKYGAQLVRRMHEDLRLLLQDYHELRGPLEHNEIDSYVQRRLEAIVTDIQELESFWSQHYQGSHGPLEQQLWEGGPNRGGLSPRRDEGFGPEVGQGDDRGFKLEEF
jgi:hypothetical protein